VKLSPWEVELRFKASPVELNTIRESRVIAMNNPDTLKKIGGEYALE